MAKKRKKDTRQQFSIELYFVIVIVNIISIHIFVAVENSSTASGRMTAAETFGTVLVTIRT